jgi:hypothetical protein
MLPEKSIQNKIRRFLVYQGAYHFKHFGCMFSRAGVPDIIACLQGRFVGIEVKSEKGKLSDLQKLNIQQIREAGGIAFVARSVGEVEEALTACGIELLPPKRKRK